jgi:coenzyme PQQ precursor peptide PqqA
MRNEGRVGHNPISENGTMKKWSKPEFQNLRYGFEINLYVTVR